MKNPHHVTRIPYRHSYFSYRVFRIAFLVPRIPHLVSNVSYRLSCIALTASRIAYHVSYCFLIVFTIMCSVGIGAGSVSLAADQPGQPADKPGTTSQEKESSPRRPLQSLEERMRGATPEERARLEKERERLSAAAAAFGTDPTAIIGYYQVNYGHTALTNNVRLDTATATARLPVTPNFGLLVNMPYAWADRDQSNLFPLRGASDFNIRAGGRIYASENIAVFVGTDAYFPTASEKQLGTGKYSLGPGGSVAVPLARLQSLFFLLVQDLNSVGGDPSRTNIHFMRLQPVINTIWSERWWSLVAFEWDIDWNSNRKTTMNLLGEVGYRFDKHWNVYAGPGIGVVGRETFLGVDWTVQAGIRWVFRTPLIPETLFGSMPMK